ncbi:MAG TPA: tetratricopeptide repeat protein [Thermoanaerobaculia bacterium]|jgi:tetratricopeptide (TPR) repeat protein|nr:tetratricopeptide repeat protein [Thermoanaerobaculia bacterium]
MKSRLLASSLLALVFAVRGARAAEQLPPRDIWPQATAAAAAGDLAEAAKKTTELTETGKSYGLKTYPLYAASAAGLARAADKGGNKDAADWARKAAAQLDPKSSQVLFSEADIAAEQGNRSRAITITMAGIGRVLANYRTSLLGRADLIVSIALAIALTAALFAIALFMRYGRAMGHDFREMLGERFHGGSVTVLGFALLFLPLFLWLGPMWLVLYWFAIFFGYAARAERVFIIILAVLLAALPVAVDYAASRMAGVESPVVISAIAGNEQSYHPEALRRMQELATVVPDNATIQILLGNLQAFEGNEQQSAVHYRRAVQLADAAGAHVNLGNLHFADNDFTAAITEYQKAQQKDPKLAIAFYNNSVASGETYKFDDQGQKLEQAKKIDPNVIERVPAGQKVVTYRPPIREAWAVATSIAKVSAARSLFGNYSYFDPLVSVVNPVTLGSLLAVLLAVAIWLKRRKTGFAGQCIKCGRTFCHRCKSARESATYCTQCIHIYLKRDGVSLATKRAKLDEVTDHHTGVSRRNKAFATFLPGSAQVLEGRTLAGVFGMFLFLLFLSLALLVGRLAPAFGPVGTTPQLMLRTVAIAVAVIIWLFLSLPVYRRKAAT